MAFGIASHVGRAQPNPKRKAAKDKDYLAFLHKLPCVFTRKFGVDAAHLSAASPKHGHYGRGKGSKASDRWCLPLDHDLHMKSHNWPGGEMRFWEEHFVNDPHGLCLAIYGLWQEAGDDAVDQCIAIIQSREW